MHGFQRVQVARNLEGLTVIGWPRSGGSPRNLNVNFVRFQHAQFHAGVFLNHLQAFFQVADFGFKLDVGLHRLIVSLLLFCKFRAQLRNAGQATASQPQLRVQNHEQCDENGWNEAPAHRLAQRRL